jgi:hypothetical protein
MDISGSVSNISVFSSARLLAAKQVGIDMSQKFMISSSQESKLTAIVLAVLSIVSIFVMLHHPSVSSENIHEQIAEVNHEAQENTIVHGVLIAFVMLINICLSYYSKVAGLQRSSVLYGLILYWVGTVVMVLAALMSGIVGPELAQHYRDASSDQAEVFRGVFLLTWEVNQACAYFSVFCWCAGIACWAYDNLSKTPLVRALGFVSITMAVVIALSLLLAWVSLSVFGMTLILIAISAWQLAIAGLIYFQGKPIT